MTIYNGTAFRNKGNDFSIPSALPAGEKAVVKTAWQPRGTKSTWELCHPGSQQLEWRFYGHME